MAIDPDEKEDADQWRFSLEDLEGRDEEESGEEPDESGSVTGTLATDEDIEAGDITLENAVFVVAGVLVAIFVIVGFVVFL